MMLGNPIHVTFKSKFNYRCLNCGIMGYHRSECRKLKQDGHRKNEKEKETNIPIDKSNEIGFSAVIGKERSRDGTRWILDSGASEHLTNNEYLLV